MWDTEVTSAGPSHSGDTPILVQRWRPERKRAGSKPPGPVGESTGVKVVSPHPQTPNPLAMPQLTHCQRSRSAPGLGSARSYISAHLTPVLGSLWGCQGLEIRGKGKAPPQASRSRGGGVWLRLGGSPLTYLLSRKGTDKQRLGKRWGSRQLRLPGKAWGGSYMVVSSGGV